MNNNKIFNATQYTIVVPIIFTLAGQFLMLYIGAVKVFEAIKLYLLKEDISDLPEHILHSDVATALLIQSLDAFLIAIVLMYFAFSLYHLFLSKDTERSRKLFPGDIAPKSIGELKKTLAEVVIVILMILFLQEIWVELNDLKWQIIIVPASILLLAASLKLVNFKD